MSCFGFVGKKTNLLHTVLLQSRKQICVMLWFCRQENKFVLCFAFVSKKQLCCVLCFCWQEILFCHSLLLSAMKQIYVVDKKKLLPTKAKYKTN
jgi:hypothetical protein